jgi:DNA polymerase iota
MAPIAISTPYGARSLDYCHTSFRDIIMPAYYDGLSGDSSSSDDDSDLDSQDSQHSGDEDSCYNERTEDTLTTAVCILHLDVDCFYGQCEHLDRGIPAERPLAIGQKHIIVTSNYAARRAGVGKLESRETALKKCPGLLIVEGSDLEDYRKHARRIYQAFREACQQECPGSAVSKGSGMDEMLADISPAIFIDRSNDSRRAKDSDSLSQEANNYFIYGEQGKETTILTEDQSGAATVVVRTAQALHASSTANHQQQAGQREHLRRNLHRAAQTACRIRRRVLDKTGFTTTLGLSVSPLLAKLAGGLKKPYTVNVLYPWHAPPLLAAMPLRKIPGIGHCTIKALHPFLLAGLDSAVGSGSGQQQQPEPSFWTCRDLLRLAPDEITASLLQIKAFEKSAAEQCRLILQKCRGVDDTGVVDDQGGLQKTVSVENSFRRGTMLTMAAVTSAMEDLYERLPRLLDDRALWSTAPTKAYPTTIRLTVRSVVRGSLLAQQQETHTKRRPFATHSKQMTIDGRAIVELKDTVGRSHLLRQLFVPLLPALLQQTGSKIDVTRINIAVTNFQDLPPSSQKSTRLDGRLGWLTQAQTRSFTTPVEGILRVSEVASVSQAARSATTPLVAKLSFSSQSSQLSRASTTWKRSNESKQPSTVVDPAVLAEVPAGIAAEVRHAYLRVPLQVPAKRKRIYQFFAPIKK